MGSGLTFHIGGLWAYGVKGLMGSGLTFHIEGLMGSGLTFHIVPREQSEM